MLKLVISFSRAPCTVKRRQTFPQRGFRAPKLQPGAPLTAEESCNDHAFLLDSSLSYIKLVKLSSAPFPAGCSIFLRKLPLFFLIWKAYPKGKEGYSLLIKPVVLFQEEDEIKPLRWRPVPPASRGSSLESWRWYVGACYRDTSISPSSPAWLVSTAAGGSGTSAEGPSLGNAAARR